MPAAQVMAVAIRPAAPRRAVKPEQVLAVAALCVFMEFVDSTIVKPACVQPDRDRRPPTLEDAMIG